MVYKILGVITGIVFFYLFVVVYDFLTGLIHLEAFVKYVFME